MKFLNNKPIRIYARSDGYWYALRDLCEAVGFVEDDLTYRLESSELECYVKTLELGSYYSVRCISHEGLEVCCYRNNIDWCYKIRDWIKDISLSEKTNSGRGIVERINTLMRLEKVKDLCEYFDIDSKDERICSLINAILDELE